MNTFDTLIQMEKFDPLFIVLVVGIAMLIFILRFFSLRSMIQAFALLNSKKTTEKYVQAYTHEEYAKHLPRIFIGFCVVFIFSVYIYIQNQSVTAFLGGVGSFLSLIGIVIQLFRMLLYSDSIRSEMVMDKSNKRILNNVRLFFMTIPLFVLACLWFIPYESVLGGDFVILNLAFILMIIIALTGIPLNLLKLIKAIQNS